MTTLARRHIHIDEVQHVSPRVIAHERRHGVVPKKRVPPLSRPAALLTEKGKPSPIEEAARKDSAVHVSLSSDSLVKQPGDHGDPPPRYAGKPPKPETSDRNRRSGHSISEELRRRAIAPESGRRAVVGAI